MISDPDLIYYTCIAKGTVVLAEFNSKDAALGAIAAECLDNTPPFHARFTHTVRSRTYSFLIDENFTYFAIFDEKLNKPEGFAFLESVKHALAGVSKGRRSLQNLSSHCFQGEMRPFFQQLLGSGLDHVEGLGSPSGTEHKLSHSGGFQSGPAPIRERSKPGWEKGLNTMKNRLLGRKKKESGEDVGNGLTVNKNGHQKAKPVWKKQVWVILSLDLMICVILFAVWLWVCSGFKCIHS
ncbi:hypothetical protein OROGR_016082 [Orobanche gracilis]